MSDKIKAIYGAEPNREGEYPSTFAIGQHCGLLYPGSVTEIRYREQNFGDHGIGWFDVYGGDVRIASLNTRFVAEIHYEAAPQPVHGLGCSCADCVGF